MLPFFNADATTTSGQNLYQSPADIDAWGRVSIGDNCPSTHRYKHF